jgi:hypothetical protein
MVSVAFGRYAHAESLLMEAVGLYGKLPEPAPVGLASCYVELAHARFLANPSEPLAAVETAKLAVKEAPPSHIGRDVIRTATELLILYRLAAGQEDVVRSNLLPSLIGHPAPEVVHREIAARYVTLCQSLLSRGVELDWQRAQVWIDRSLELDSRNSDALWVAAQLAYLRGDVAACLDFLVRSLRAGSDPWAVGAFVAELLQRDPDQTELQQFSAWLQREFGVVVPTPTTQPGTTTAPAASRPIMPDSEPSAPPDPVFSE